MDHSKKKDVDDKLSKDQTHGIALLSLGTFLEYFDCMLHIHLAVVLNDLFFSQNNRFTPFIPAFTFCSNFVLKPFGAILFGYLGDLLGRKVTIIIATTLMACCCVVVAALPTYAQIGITAPIVLTICRAIQNISVTAEVVGVEIYVTETVKTPRKQYRLVTFMVVIMSLGGLAALGVGYIVTSLIPPEWSKNAWRFAFLLGACIGIIGAVARRSLREASEFADRSTIKQQLKEQHSNIAIQPKTEVLTSIAYFGIRCGGPACFYLIYIYCGEILRKDFGFTAAQVITNNFWVTFVDTIALLVLSYITYYISPLKITRVSLICFFTFLGIFLVQMHLNPSPQVVFYFQCTACCVTFDQVPANALFFKYFPVFARFRYVAIINAVALLVTISSMSFGMVFATAKLGISGLLVILVPLGLFFHWSLKYFENKEKSDPHGIT